MSVLKAARLSKKPPLNRQELWQLDAYWRAANYLTACQLYLLDNPLLERPLKKAYTAPHKQGNRTLGCRRQEPPAA